MNEKSVWYIAEIGRSRMSKPEEKTTAEELRTNVVFRLFKFEKDLLRGILVLESDKEKQTWLEITRLARLGLSLEDKLREAAKLKGKS